MPKTKTKIKKLTIAGAVYTLLFAGAGVGIVDRDNNPKCGGVERWDEKVLIDDKVDEIDVTPVVTTIQQLNLISTQGITITGSTKRQEIEKQVYTVKDCFITHAIREADNDLHIVIEDGKGGHMIAEIPDPQCPDAKKSQFIKRFKEAQQVFLKYQNVYDRYRFDITGVLFVDKKHSMNPTGNASNNIELHPVIHLQESSQL
jgi:hypothetical protein